MAATASPASAQVEERVIYASVVDQAGQPVTDLTAGDFVVREDRFAREILRVSRAYEPMQIALLVDNSQALESHVSDLRRGISALVKGLHEANQIALISLASRPTIVVDYTRDLPRLEAGVSRIHAESGTGAYLLDGIRETSIGLVKRDARRPVIVVVTAQGPEMSDRDHAEVLKELRRSGATLLAIVITMGGGSRTNEHGREREYVLNEGTNATGGRHEEVGTTSSLEMKLTQVAAELSNQYRVVYAHPQELIPPESIQVSVRRPGLTARGTPMKTSDAK
jgi:VWFA-related protein